MVCPDLFGDNRNITISEAIEILKKNDKISEDLRRSCLAFLKTLKEITCQGQFNMEILAKLISLSTLCEGFCTSNPESVIKYVIQFNNIAVNDEPN